MVLEPRPDRLRRTLLTAITVLALAIGFAVTTTSVEPGLAASGCVSFQSADKPGFYIRHYAFELYLDADNGTTQFAGDATFCPRGGTSGTGYSLQSSNYPAKYIRHYNFTGYIAADGGSNAWDTATSWPQDTSWLAASPWS